MLEDSGERVIPEEMDITNELLVEHITRYHFALPFISKGRVLDFASGSGFGTHIIAKKKNKTIDEVIGLDNDPAAVNYAKGKYYHPKSSFIKADVTNPSLPDQIGTFDTIVSFETYEHIEDEAMFIKNVYQLLKPGGNLILSTPFGKGRGVPCGSPFHVHQITVEEFHDLFKDYSYQSCDFYYQCGALIQHESDLLLDYYPLGILVLVK